MGSDGTLLTSTGDTTKSMSKSKLRRMKRKMNRSEKNKAIKRTAETDPLMETEEENNDEVEIVYVGADIKDMVSENDPSYEEMAKVFEKFISPEELCNDKKRWSELNTDMEEPPNDEKKEEKETQEENPKGSVAVAVSRKQKKKLKRLTVAELKQLVVRPDVVEAHDITSADPRLLVYLKSYRNTVSVPRHWCHKRKYLQGKRGVEKVPFVLPDFIARTGIAEIRSANMEEEDKKKMKTKAREKMQPKMGRIDIDYQVLHNAFFKYQKKPSFTILGDLYYEGKEFEVKVKSKAPGILSNELKKSLGMSDGVPPPWLLNMQRYGPPPSYPNLRIPGLNAPIPPGASFGYHPGGWGKPPVDENGRPLYGDVFAKPQQKINNQEGDALISKERWGEIQEKEEEDIEDEEEVRNEEEEQAEDIEVPGTNTPFTDGFNSVAAGIATPSGIVLKKDLPQAETPIATQAYKVLAQKNASLDNSLYGSSYTYAVNEPNKESMKKTEEIVEDKELSEKKSKKYKDFKF